MRLPGTYISPAETGFYYLGSRYYDPSICRFINADNENLLAATPIAFTDKNYYSYCDNNPVVRADYNGEFWHVAIGAIVGAAINVGISTISSLMENGEPPSVKDIVVSAISGAISGSLSAAGVPAIATTITDGLLGVGESLYNDITYNSNPENINKKSVGKIITNAVVDGGVSMLFSSAGGDCGGETLTHLWKKGTSLKKSAIAGSRKAAKTIRRRYWKRVPAFTRKTITTSAFSGVSSMTSKWLIKGSYGNYKD